MSLGRRLYSFHQADALTVYCLFFLLNTLHPYKLQVTKYILHIESVNRKGIRFLIQGFAPTYLINKFTHPINKFGHDPLSCATWR